MEGADVDGLYVALRTLLGQGTRLVRYCTPDELVAPDIVAVPGVNVVIGVSPVTQLGQTVKSVTPLLVAVGIAPLNDGLQYSMKLS